MKRCKIQSFKTKITNLLFLLMILFFIVAIYFGVKAVHLFSSIEKQEENMTALSTPLITKKLHRERLPIYQSYVVNNSHMVGWIQIPNTAIDYPLMFTPDEPNYYLNHDFDGNKSTYGLPYLKEDCEINKPSDNLVIYGHNMKNGAMFHELLYYTTPSFYEDHKRILVDTLTQRKEYEVVYAFETNASIEGFAYENFINASSKKDFDAFIKQCAELSLIDTNTTPIYGDELLTLSTCTYTQENGRFVVVGKRIIK